MNPKKLFPGRANRRKPIHGGLNLNGLSLGELIRLYDKEKRENGDQTRFCVALRSAIDKAKEFERTIMDSKEENKMHMTAAAKRWPMTAATKRLAIETAVELMEHYDPVARASGVRAIIAFEKQNQADDHHDNPIDQNLNVKLTVEAVALRNAMMGDPDIAELLRKRAMNGVGHEKN